MTPIMIVNLGLSADFVGVILLLIYAIKTVGAITQVDMNILASPQWFHWGYGLLALGFLGQILGNSL